MNNGTSNVTATPNLDDNFYGRTDQIIELVFLGQIAVLILLGNILVILAFSKGPRRIRTYTNYFVINLAVCDILVGCISVPIWMCMRTGKIFYIFEWVRRTIIMAHKN